MNNTTFYYRNYNKSNENILKNMNNNNPTSFQTVLEEEDIKELYKSIIFDTIGGIDIFIEKTKLKLSDERNFLRKIIDLLKNDYYKTFNKNQLWKRVKKLCSYIENLLYY